MQFGILLTTFVATATALRVRRHKVAHKSLQEASIECNKYNVHGDCLARCVTLLTRDWYDSSNGISPVYSRFFQPGTHDRCGIDRTQKCLQARVPTTTSLDTCYRATASVQCYMDQYGEVNVTTPQFIRFTILQDARLVYECATMLGYSSPEQLNALLNDKEFLRLETRCVMRCFMIRSGLYSDSEGLNMARYYVQCGGYEDNFYERVAQCSVKLRQEIPCEDKCTLSQRLATECIGVDYATSTIMQQQGDTLNSVVAAQGSKVYMVNDQNANSNVSYHVMSSGDSTKIGNKDSSSKFGGNDLEVFMQSITNRR
ncbi:general odorant-binding protein 45-like [Armigeres subalbatus]|uniref:general odorant-binding protein 45-like n=1 Tax=Armigeres subalbatus TaxID=124917 RepID=UPI002ED4AC80